jgi:predicted DNA-binding transcriptional regulator AlpA
MEKLNDDHMEKLMDKKGVARAFGVTVKAVDKWVSDKKLPYIKISPKCVRFRPSAIRAYLNSRTVRPEARNSLTTMQRRKFE